jgi:methionyl-tRNA formyltransferase
VTYAHKIDKHEALIDWALPAETIARRIRAFDPFPGASTLAQGEAVKLWSCEIDSCSRLPGAAPGQILSVEDASVRVACGQGVLRLTVLQRAGGKRLRAAEFLRGFALPQGLVLGA